MLYKVNGLNDANGGMSYCDELGAGERAQPGKALAAKPGDLSSIPVTYMLEGEH